jgi:hypothetical protein
MTPSRPDGDVPLGVNPPGQASRTPPKRHYSPPHLVEYGHIGKLTQGASGNMAETGGMMMGCL